MKQLAKKNNEKPAGITEQLGSAISSLFGSEQKSKPEPKPAAKKRMKK